MARGAPCQGQHLAAAHFGYRQHEAPPVPTPPCTILGAQWAGANQAQEMGLPQCSQSSCSILPAACAVLGFHFAVQSKGRVPPKLEVKHYNLLSTLSEVLGTHILSSAK